MTAKPKRLLQPEFKVSALLGLTPAPIQLALLACKEFEIGMITGFAAGKTRGLCAAAITHAVRYPRAKVLLGRKTYAEMVNTVKQPFFQMAEPLYEAGWFIKPEKWDYREGTNHAKLINGSQFIFSNLDDPVKFRNEEYSLVLVDQAEEIDETLWETLTGRIRWDETPPEAWQAVAAANDNGHNWLWRRFVQIPSLHSQDSRRCRLHPYCVFEEHHPDAEGLPQALPCSTRRFFHGTTLDNKHNLSPRYLAVLLSHPPEWQKHFIYATMEGGAGRLLPDPVIIAHVDPPVHWPRWRSIDHALNSPCCCLWLTVNPDESEYKGIIPNAVYVYREYWFEKRSVDQHAGGIISASARERYMDTVIDRSTFNLTQSRRDGGRVSIADLYAEEGLPCSPSVGDPFARVERIITAHNRGLIISQLCGHLIKQMPDYYAEASRTDGLYKIVNKSDFHAVDALGMGLMVIPQKSMSDMNLYDIAKPDYLRKSGVDPFTRRHHKAEWERMKRIQEQNQLSELPPAIGSIKTTEFWKDEIEFEPEVVMPFDPWGRD